MKATKIQDTKVIGVILSVLFLLLGCIRYKGDYLYSGWFFGSVGAVILTGICLCWSNRFLFISYLYFGLNALYIAAFRDNRFVKAGYSTQFLIYSNAAFFLALITLFLFLQNKKRHLGPTVFKAFGVICILNSILVILGHFFKFGYLPEGVGVSGLINYASLNGCLIATTIPFVFLLPKYFWPLIIASIYAVVLSKSSVPYGVLALTLTGLFYKRIFTKKVVYALIIFGLVIGVGLVFEGSRLFDSAERFNAYRLFMKTWADLPNPMIYFGTGPGTFMVLGPEIQIKNKFMVNDRHIFLWTAMHCDYLQVLFETGIIGLGLFCLLGYRALKYHYENCVYKFSATLGYLGMMLFNYPLRYYLTLSLGVVLLWGTSWANEHKRLEILLQKVRARI